MLIRLTAIMMGLALAPVAAMAQDSQPPARIGNVYNGTAHEPDPGTVHARESAAGVAPAPSTSQAETGSIEQLDKQVQSNASPQNVAPAKSLACSVSAAACSK